MKTIAVEKTKIDSITIQLTGDEAQVLYDIFWTGITGKTGGDRGITNKIGNALYVAGFRSKNVYSGALDLDKLDEPDEDDL